MSVIFHAKYNSNNKNILKLLKKILKCFIQQYIRENETIEKTINNNHNFVNKSKSYHQSNKEKRKKDNKNIIEISQKKKK